MMTDTNIQDPHAGKTGFWADAIRGLIDISPLMAGAAPFALLLGSLAVQKGLSPAEVTLMSFSVYAGSAQFIAIDIWQTPVPILAIVGTTLLVNLRHLLMGAALAPHLGGLSPLGRFLTVSIHSDETWAMALRRAQAHGSAGVTPGYIFGVFVLFYLQWPFWTCVGAFTGSLFGDPATYGIDFVFPAVFITLVIGFWRASRQSLVVLVSLGTALLAYHLIEGVWYIFLAGLAGTVTGGLLYKGEAAAHD
jgi:4-azaleucine resistance transporter AzlC